MKIYTFLRNDSEMKLAGSMMIGINELHVTSQIMIYTTNL